MIKLLGILFLGVVAPNCAKDTTPALAIANLTDPAKLATLKGERSRKPKASEMRLLARPGRGAGEQTRSRSG